MSHGVSDKMRLVSHDTIMRLIEGIEAGESNRGLAKFAGVCKRTAMSYRRMYLEAALGDDPKLCGCGRPIKHQGTCKFRTNKLAGVTEGKEKP